MKKILTLSIAFFLYSCMDPSSPSDDKSGSGGFDFVTTKVYNIDVNYRLNGYQSKILFEVYVENPYTVDGSALKGIEPIMRAVTDVNGEFSGTFLMPLYADSVYLRTDYLGMPSLVALPFKMGDISFDLNNGVQDQVAKTRAVYSYPSGMLVLGEWSKNGVPSYKMSNAVIPNNLLTDIKQILVENVSLATAHPEFFSGDNKTIKVTANASVEMVFLHESSFLTNSVGYYTYTTGTPPTNLSQVKRILAFPNASFLYSDGGLASGSRVKLKYWNGSAFQDEFPAGTTIGFFSIPNGFGKPSSNISDITAYYSNNGLINMQKQHIVCYNDQVRALCVLGIEDNNNVKFDFNENIFYLQSTPRNAITTEPQPDNGEEDPNPNPADNYTEYKGTLIFEDLWPHLGDYDINDVVVEYTSKVYKNLDNKIVRVEDFFRPVNNGAQIQSAFAYQYGVASSAVKSMSMTTTRPAGLVNQSDYVPVEWNIDSKGFEQGQSLATLLLFDDIRTVAGKTSQPIEYLVNTEFNTPQDINILGYPPYNPFIIIVRDGDNARRELHLSNKLPTQKATSQWFGYANDRSEPARGICYISNDDYPFALCVPIHGFKLQVEGRIINELYSGYHQWATSKGELNKDWYLR